MQTRRYVGVMVSKKQMKIVVVLNVLKIAWANFESVNITDRKENLVKMEFQSQKDKKLILDQSPRSNQGHYPIKKREQNLSNGETYVTWIQFWIQIDGQELGVLSSTKTRRIEEGISRCIQMEEMNDQIKRSFIRIKVEIDSKKPLIVGFWWTNPRGEDR